MLDRSKQVLRTFLLVHIGDSVEHGAQPFEPAAVAALGSGRNRNAVARPRLGAAYTDSERHLSLLWTAWSQAPFSATSPFTMHLTYGTFCQRHRMRVCRSGRICAIGHPMPTAVSTPEYPFSPP